MLFISVVFACIEGSPVLCDGVRKWRGLDVPHSEVASLRRRSGPVLCCRNYFSPYVSP